MLNNPFCYEKIPWKLAQVSDIGDYGVARTGVVCRETFFALICYHGYFSFWNILINDCGGLAELQEFR